MQYKGRKFFMLIVYNIIFLFVSLSSRHYTEIFDMKKMIALITLKIRKSYELILLNSRELISRQNLLLGNVMKNVSGKYRANGFTIYFYLNFISSRKNIKILFLLNFAIIIYKPLT